MKATIKEIKNHAEDRYMFILYADDKVIKCMCYKPEAPKGDIWNREYNLNRAMDKVKFIESIDSIDSINTIYTTPE